MRLMFVSTSTSLWYQEPAAVSSSLCRCWVSGNWTLGLHACIGSNFPDWAISRKFGLTLFEAFHAQDGCYKHQRTSVWEVVFPWKAHSQLSQLQTLGFFLKELSSLHNQPDMQVIYKRVLAHNYKAICLLYTNIHARLKFTIFRSQPRTW